MLEKTQALQAQIQQIILIENQRHQQDKTTIQELQSSVENWTNQNNNLHDHIEILQSMIANLEEEPEEDLEEEPTEDEAVGDGEIID